MDHIKLINTYLGFTDNLKPMQRAKVEKVLDGLIRVDGIVVTQKEWVYNKLQSGAKPYKQENYSYYSSRTNAMTKPKTLYRLEWEQERYDVDGDTAYDALYNEINKTLYDFACYIINNKLLDVSVLNSHITTEQQNIESEERKEEQRKLLEKTKIEQEEKEQELFRNWFGKKMDEYKNQENIDTYMTMFKNDYPELNTKEFQAIKFLVYIENIDNIRCRQALKDILHIHNKTSKKIFHAITGIKLPNTDRETMTLLNSITAKDYVNGKQAHIEKSQNNLGKEKFYRYVNGVGFIRAYGVRVEYSNITAFIFESRETGTVAIESKTGCVIARKNASNDIEKELKRVVDTKGMDVIELFINKAVEKNGISPLCKEAASATS